MKLTKADLIAELAKVTGQNGADIERILAAYADLAIAELSNGIAVPLPGIGILKAKDRPARMGRNPRTGDPAPVPARRVITFTAGKAAKDQVDA